MTTVSAIRAKRARELQAALQTAARVEASFRPKIAGMVAAWRVAYKKAMRAANRYNAMVEQANPDLVIASDDILTPAALLENLKVRTEVKTLLNDLREKGAKISRLPSSKERRAKSKRDRDGGERKRLLKAVRELTARLKNDEEMASHRHAQNSIRRFEGQPEFSASEYADVVEGYLRDAQARLKALRK